MKKNKGKTIKEVKFYPEEWDRIMELSKKYNKLPAAYIREKAVDGKILNTDYFVMLCESGNSEDVKASYDINKIAKTVNTEKTIFAKDVIELERTIRSLEDFVHNGLLPFTYREVTFSWQ